MVSICSLGGPTGDCRGSTPYICSHMRFGRLVMAPQLIDALLGALTDVTTESKCPNTKASFQCMIEIKKRPSLIK